MYTWSSFISLLWKYILKKIIQLIMHPIVAFPVADNNFLNLCFRSPKLFFLIFLGR